jgi:hypothetical protein
MRRFGALLFFAIVVTMAVAAQTATQSKSEARPVKKNPLAAYAGTWTGSFEGKSWLTLKLVLQADRLSGSIERPRNLQFNDQGEIKSVSDEQSTEVVQDAQVNPDGLLLTVKNSDSQEINRYTMRLTSESAAELKMSAMSMPPGMPKIRPWKLTKVGASPAPSSQR